MDNSMYVILFTFFLYNLYHSFIAFLYNSYSQFITLFVFALLFISLSGCLYIYIYIYKKNQFLRKFLFIYL